MSLAVCFYTGMMDVGLVQVFRMWISQLALVFSHEENSRKNILSKRLLSSLFVPWLDFLIHESTLMKSFTSHPWMKEVIAAPMPSVPQISAQTLSMPLHTRHSSLAQLENSKLNLLLVLHSTLAFLHNSPNCLHTPTHFIIYITRLFNLCI